MKVFSVVVKMVVPLVLLAVNSIDLSAQLINKSDGNFLTDKPFFNEEVIREKGIKSISGTEIHYKLGDKPRDTDYFRKYNFNQNGQLVQQLESVAFTKENDTLVTFYDYNDQGDVKAVRQYDGFGNYAYFYEYDEQGRIVHEEYRRNLTSTVQKSPDFILGEEYSVSSEKSTYSIYGDEQRRTIYTNDNLPYKYISTYYNRKGLITEKVENFERLPGKKTTKFHYNHKSEVDSITVKSNISGFQNRSFKFAYDKQGNLLKKEEFKNGTYVSQYQVLYDDETMLIDDVLVQNISMDFIKVLELRKYDYYFDVN